MFKAKSGFIVFMFKGVYKPLIQSQISGCVMDVTPLILSSFKCMDPCQLQCVLLFSQALQCTGAFYQRPAVEKNGPNFQGHLGTLTLGKTQCDSRFVVKND